MAATPLRLKRIVSWQPERPPPRGGGGITPMEQESAGAMSAYQPSLSLRMLVFEQASALDSVLIVLLMCRTLSPSSFCRSPVSIVLMLKTMTPPFPAGAAAAGVADSPAESPPSGITMQVFACGLMVMMR